MNTRQSFFSFCKELLPILHAIKNVGGTSYLVGGSVRDLALDRELKDFDIEVHGLAPEQLEKVLGSFQPVILVGKKFGVFRLPGFDVDWSLPRRDSKGRKPEVNIDPTMNIQDACRRRDLTMNAMAIDLNLVIDNFQVQQATPLTIIDPYGGLADIEKKQLRAVDQELFLEDPLRFYRVMHFVGRFGMQPDAQLNSICQKMSLWDSQTESALARERIYDEIKKLMLKSDQPSLGFRWLLQINRLGDTFPELQALVAVQQRPDWHPEGSVFEHTMQALDATTAIPISDNALGIYYKSQQEKFMIMLATLCHDVGKAVTTDANLSAHGHDIAGVPIAQKLLQSLTNDQTIKKGVCKLVRHHLAPFAFVDQGAGEKAYKRLAVKLAPEVTLRQLGLVAIADWQGRNGNEHKPLISEKVYADYKRFIEKTEQAAVTHGPEAPLLLGRDLIDVVPAGPELGQLLQRAYDIQIEEGVSDIQELKRRVLLSKKKSS